MVYFQSWTTVWTTLVIPGMLVGPISASETWIGQVWRESQRLFRHALWKVDRLQVLWVPWWSECTVDRVCEYSQTLIRFQRQWMDKNTRNIYEWNGELIQTLLWKYLQLSCIWECWWYEVDLETDKSLSRTWFGCRLQRWVKITEFTPIVPEFVWKWRS